MPWLSPLDSPAVSPRSGYHSKLTNGMNNTMAGQMPLAVTFIPSLIDGACGTLPNPRRSAMERMRGDMSHALTLLPDMLRAAMPRRWASASRMEMMEMVQHACLAMLEMCFLACVVPLWACLPGLMFAAWMGCCMSMIMCMVWMLNGRGSAGQMVRSTAAGDWMMGQDMEDERWFFVGGVGVSSRTMTQSTLPMLSKLFNRTITSVCAPTYGLPFDMLALILQRSLHTMMPSPTTTAMYAQVRASLLDRSVSRTVVLAHNSGAVCASQILRQLYADVSPDKMSKLEVYTFGAAATDFVTPLGGTAASAVADSKRLAGQQQMHAAGVVESREPHIEHFAFVNDPLARMGVLRSVREDLEGRFCGGVFVLNCPGSMHHCEERTAGNIASRPMMSMTDYMSCLFPQQHQEQSHNSPGNVEQCSSILDCMMAIDRDTAEKREFAAMANQNNSNSSEKRTKRLSWTGLGATANGMKGSMDGVVGLEMARTGCRECEGHRARDVSRLARYAGLHQQGRFSAGSMDNRRDVAEASGVGKVQ
ncbi:hypothetical protein INS49_009476 [Diaporthe citri]|uniref:uncharacterized protein n=1 Tax=Diaporthe citri TaxID=83186 RepID=UPI001C820267|nr:uncharacterized protein INS49_009476 [Diaporthe citri]KAG6361252.1 hypothetical protein INS49_009476 [Diaporthe citri]